MNNQVTQSTATPGPDFDSKLAAPQALEKLLGLLGPHTTQGELHEAARQCARLSKTEPDPTNARAWRELQAATGRTSIPPELGQPAINEGWQKGLQEAAWSPEEATKGDWTDDLETTGKAETPKASQHNATLICRNDPKIKGVLAFNVLETQSVWLRPPPWDMAAGPYPRAVLEHDPDRASVYMRQTHEVAFEPAKLGRAFEVAARDHEIDPVRDYLESLTWDQEPRLECWLVEAFEAEETPLNRAFGACWLLSAVARALRPGCKADHVLVLEGEQGIGKSQALAALLPDPSWFSDQGLDADSKDGQLDNQGVWIREIAELSGLHKSDVERIKAYVTRTNDRYRPPYGKVAEDHPRRLVFAASTNRTEGYLQDTTGNRRFWPVRVLKADPIWVARNRDQLWAEAVQRFKAGARWWLDDSLETAARGAQDQRLQVDPWVDELAPVFANRTDASTAEAFRVLGIAPEKKNKALEMRVAEVLKAMGFMDHKRVLVNGQRTWRYAKPPGHLCPTATPASDPAGQLAWLQVVPQIPPGCPPTRE